MHESVPAGHTDTELPAWQFAKGDEPMNRKYSLLLAAAVCMLTCCACGGRTADDRRTDRSDATTVRTERVTTTRTETTDRNGIREDAGEMMSDAAQDASEMVSDAVRNGREIVTDIASDASEAAADRKGDGDYRTNENGRVAETTTAR